MSLRCIIDDLHLTVTFLEFLIEKLNEIELNMERHADGLLSLIYESQSDTPSQELQPDDSRDGNIQENVSVPPDETVRNVIEAESDHIIIEVHNMDFCELRHFNNYDSR